MTANQVRGVLNAARARVEETVARLLARGPEDLAPLLRYHLGYGPGPGGIPPGSGGKRVRAALCLLSCEAVGGEAERAVPLAAALELVHGFTLLHDDIADGDETRRGQPTVWRLWGVGQALTAGDAMFALANLALFEPAPGLSPEVAHGLLRGLNEAIFAVCEGQSRDLAFEAKSDVGVADYLEMIRLKTAALISAATELGARAGGGTAPQVEALSQFGLQLGLAFQIRDDVLGLWGEAGEVGKPVGSDLQHNKRSLPVLLALSPDSPLATELSARLPAGLNSEEAAEVAGRMERAGIRRQCEEMARERLEAARRALHSCPLREDAAASLEALARYVVERSQ